MAVFNTPGAQPCISGTFSSSPFNTLEQTFSNPTVSTRAISDSNKRSPYLSGFAGDLRVGDILVCNPPSKISGLQGPHDPALVSSVHRLYFERREVALLLLLNPVNPLGACLIHDGFQRIMTQAGSNFTYFVTSSSSR